MLLLFDKPPDMPFGSVKEKSDASRLLSLKSFFFVSIVLSFVIIIVLCIEGRETYVEEGSCIEGNGSLSRSLEGWEKKPGRLGCCFIYTPVSTVS